MPADPNRRAKATADTGAMDPRAKALALAVSIVVVVAVAVAIMYLSGSFSMTSVEIRH
jgi:hypothetical protein